MSRRGANTQIDLGMLLEYGKRVPPQPKSVRARVLGRARVTAALPPTTLQPPPAVESTLPWHLLSPAAAVALAGGVAATLYALSGTRSPPEERLPLSSPMTVSSGQPATAHPEATTPAPGAATPAAKPSAAPAVKAQPRTRRPEPTPASDTAEFEVIRSAHSAYVSHDFATALRLVGEHAQRFPHGLLAEEREALRIRCLLGSGRRPEAERAASAFARRFPRSVLLPHLRTALGAGEE
jgi:hypothetical protein